MPASSGAATAVVTPGTTSNGMPAMRQRQRFFGAAAEHERVAALQPHDALALPRGADHQPIDRLLPDAGAAGALADAEALRLRQPPQRLGVDQRVVQHQVGFLDALAARARSTARDRPDLHRPARRGLRP